MITLLWLVLAVWVGAVVGAVAMAVAAADRAAPRPTCCAACGTPIEVP